jgi:glycosyltransferase involved in cell wall biosynthesis
MQAWLAHLMPDLVAAGFEVGLALPVGPHNDAAAYLAKYPFEPHVLIDNPTSSRLGQLRGIERALERWRPDLLVVANIVAAYRAVEELRARREWAPRVAACVHTLAPGIFEDLKRLSHVVDALIAPNRLIAAAGREIAELEGERIFHAPYRVERPPFEWRQSEGKVQHLVFAHRLDQGQKRALDLVPLVAALARRGVAFELDVVGDGEEGEALRQALASEVAAGRVRFHGWIAPEALRARVFERPGAALLILSSWEMGPMIAWQAMAWGVPVVSSRYLGSGLEGVLAHDANALLFPVGEVEDAAGACARLAAEPGLGRRLAERAWRDVGERFSTEVATEAWAEAIEETLALPALPRPATLPRIAPAGRLDRWLGVEGAETLRRALGARIPTRSAGEEWPHTGGGGLPAEEFLARLARLDRGA